MATDAQPSSSPAAVASRPIALVAAQGQWDHTGLFREGAMLRNAERFLIARHRACDIAASPG
jgi:hypothetical protein